MIFIMLIRLLSYIIRLMVNQEGMLSLSTNMNVICIVSNQYLDLVLIFQNQPGGLKWRMLRSNSTKLVFTNPCIHCIFLNTNLGTQIFNF